jgi:UDP-N-acetylglucosamine 2-epimerase
MLDPSSRSSDSGPIYDLNIMEPGQTLAMITSKTLVGYGQGVEEAKPDIVLVHGDTSLPLRERYHSFYHKIPVGHVEAGLRTGDAIHPIRKINRRLISEIASLHFSPTVAMPGI